MISSLSGVIIEKKPPFFVLDVNGVGYELQSSMTTFSQLPELKNKIFIKTHLVTREDGQYLYGFIDDREREVFRQLIKASGVGPKLALAILSGMSTNDFLDCIENKNIGLLVKLPGVGKKTAERLIIEMQGKLSINSTNLNSSISNDAVSALLALGYKMQEAQKAVTKFVKETTDQNQLIKLALQSLAK